MARLTQIKVAKLKRDYEKGLTLTALSKKYGVTEPAISQMGIRKGWNKGGRLSRLPPIEERKPRQKRHNERKEAVRPSPIAYRNAVDVVKEAAGELVNGQLIELEYTRVTKSAEVECMALDEAKALLLKAPDVELIQDRAILFRLVTTGLAAIATASVKIRPSMTPSLDDSTTGAGEVLAQYAIVKRIADKGNEQYNDKH